MTFAGDHFSRQASAYSAFRPRYPDTLGAWLATIAPTPGRAWDCATGNGQAAVMLAAHFNQVIATDASAAQLQHATSHPRVTYRQATADASGLPDAGCALVTVAQAAHWFGLAAFYNEVRRVLMPGGVVAIWGYALLHSERPGLDSVVHHFQRKRLAEYWPAGRELVDDEYRSLSFPFEELSTPAFAMTATWRKRELLGYISSWSATARCRDAEGIDPMREINDALTRVWPDADTPVEIRWPLFLRVGRV
jgi:SAM-dependent methyltransferase